MGEGGLRDSASGIPKQMQSHLCPASTASVNNAKTKQQLKEEEKKQIKWKFVGFSE